MKASSCLKWRLSSYLPCTAVYCLDSTTVGISNLAVPSATRNIFGGLHAKAPALKNLLTFYFTLKRLPDEIRLILCQMSGAPVQFIK